MTINEVMRFEGVTCYRRDSWFEETGIYLVEDELIYRRFRSSIGWRYIVTREDLVATDWNLVVLITEGV